VPKGKEDDISGEDSDSNSTKTNVTDEWSTQAVVDIERTSSDSETETMSLNNTVREESKNSGRGTLTDQTMSDWMRMFMEESRRK